MAKAVMAKAVMAKAVMVNGCIIAKRCFIVGAVLALAWGVALPAAARADIFQADISQADIFQMESAGVTPSLNTEALERLEKQLGRGHVDAVIDELAAHLEADTADARARLLYGRALSAADRHTDALVHFEQARDTGLAGSPEVAEAIARATWMNGEPYEARVLWRSLLEQAHNRGDNRGDGHHWAAADLRALARAAWALGRHRPNMFKTSLDIYEQAIKAAPDADEARLELGELLLEKYNSAEATELFTEVLERHQGKHVRALTLLAEAQQFDQLRAAGDAVEQVLQLDEAYVPALLLRAQLHVDLEEFAEAEAVLALVFKVNRSNRKALILRAAIAYLQDHEELFRTTMITLREAAPRSGDHLVTLAEIAARNRRYRAAAEFALIAANIEPGAWAAHVLLGINRMRDGELESGRHALEVAFRGDPYNIWARNTLALMDKMRATFIELRSQHFVLTAKSAEAAVIGPYLLPLAEEAFAYYKERYQHEPATPIRIEMFAEHEDFSVRTAGLVGLDILGVSFGPVVALDSPSAGRFGAVNWGSVLWHELAHTFHLSKSGHRSPRWFSEGLAVHEEHRARAGWGADVTPDFLIAYREGRLPPASRMNDSFLRPKYARQVIHGYLQGSVFIDFLQAEHGFAPIDRMLSGFAEGQRMETLVPELLGYDIAALDARFDEYFRQRFAGELAALGGAGTGGAGTKEGETDEASPLERTMAAAKQALQDQDSSTAQALLLQAQEQFPSFAGEGSPYRLLAQLHEAQGRLEQAADWLRRNIDINADDLFAHHELARILSALERRDEAAAVLRRALYIDPFDTGVHRALADVYESNDEWWPAVDARRAVVLLEPLDMVAARRRLAQALVETGAVEGARFELLQALEQAPLYEDGLELLLQINEGEVNGVQTPASGILAPRLSP
ncbi:MAG: tetratricopeptide repeat protein [Gammaproteobacteria bacterium]|nr:tetratricopeptide repeat protein [Gammaproteobacteria bacterium]